MTALILIVTLIVTRTLQYRVLESTSNSKTDCDGDSSTRSDNVSTDVPTILPVLILNFTLEKQSDVS